MILRLAFVLAAALVSGPGGGGGGSGPGTGPGPPTAGPEARAGPAEPIPRAPEARSAPGDTVPAASEALPAPSDLVAAGDTIPRGSRVRAPASGGLFAEDSPLGDLAVRFRGRGEFGGDWTIFRPCDAAFQLTCNPGLIPQLQPDVQFSLEVDGSLAGRLFMDVDYDQTREFGGANRFRIYYQGLEGETLQRVELGDVTFALPDSRFLTRGIPAGNFGLLAEGEAGGVTFQTLAAQQQGSRQSREFRLGADDAGVIREDTLVIDDAQYVRGQFFFVADPSRIRGFPHLDVLNLRPGDAEPAEAPGAPPIQLWRMERDPILRQQVEGYIRADASLAGENGLPVVESGWFRHLRPGTDYYLHPSGLWVGLRIPLRPDEALAVTYINVQGDTIGDYNPERIHNEGGVPELRLLRAAQARHQPDRATWDRELRQVYRLSGSDEVDLETVEVSVSLGEAAWGRTFKSRPEGGRISLLRLFGVDEHSPFERVDRSSLFQPAAEGVVQVGIAGTFLIFPTLRPFLEPPPLVSEGLPADRTREILGQDANRRIYEAEDPLDREGGGLYRLNVSLRTRSSGVTSTFSLGAFGIREGSERLVLGDRLLRPGVDYLLDTEVGVVTLLQPDFLLARSASNLLRITWEQVSLFRPRPTSLVGASARVPLGEGSLDVLGIYQAEREVLNRPRFGAEPPAVGMVGARTLLNWELPALDGFLKRMLGERRRQALGEPRPASLTVEGELAVSLPNPNVSGDAFLDDFDAGEERTVSLLNPAWHLGSAPDFRTGAELELPETLGVESTLPLVWQHTWVEEGPAGDSIGVFEGLFPRSDIDRQINIAGSQTREPGLLLSFGTAPGTEHESPRWRSMTTLLSPTGADLTQTEFLDFYVAEGDSVTLVFDLGLVSEDAFFIDENGDTGGFRPDIGRSWGLGVLDQEADPQRGEIWNLDADRRGVWPEPCLAEQGRVYRIGDPTANCTRGNGRRDTEDLNGNGVLDTEERYARYVVRLDGTSPFLVRNRVQTGTGFRLYRIPLRGPLTVYPAGPLTQADWRNVQFLRMTVAGERSSRLMLARMRLVGSRWIKRGGEGLFRGIGGDTLTLAGSFEVTPVGTITEGAAYRSPPGVLEQLDDPTSAVVGRGVEFSERSLALRFQDLGSEDRGEVYFRFFQRPRDFLAYKQLRLWAVARSGDFGASQPTDFFVKVGSDPDNFYLWRTRLEPALDGGGVQPEDWLPERVIEFDRWMVLRRRAEERLILQPPPEGEPLVLWSSDSTYAVVLKDRARAPNLGAVREISMGVWNRGEGLIGGELWINELRLGGGVRSSGRARHLTVDLDGGDLLQARLSLDGSSPWFRSMEESPTYRTQDALNLSGTLQLGGVFPETWAVDLPLSVSHHRSGQDPFFLEGTDLRAGQVSNLRTGRLRESRAAVTLRTDVETGRAAVDRALSALDARAAFSWSDGRTLTTESRSLATEAGIGATVRPDARHVPLVPGFLGPVVRVFLPPGMARRLMEAEWRWTPEEVRAGTTHRRRDFRLTRFDQIVRFAPGDSGTVQEAPESWLDSRARIAFRPGGTLTASLDITTRRDLLNPDEGVLDPRVRSLVEQQRREMLGVGLGWETRRHMVARVGVRPQLYRGVRTDFSAQTRFGSERDAGLFQPISPTGDPLAPGFTPSTLLRNARVDREVRSGITVEPRQLLFGLPDPDSEATPGPLERAIGSISPMNLTVQDGIFSAFFREPVDPGFGFQLGLGGIEDLRTLGGAQAASLVDRRAVSAGSGLRLPAGGFFNLNFQTTRVSSLDRRSEREARTRSWPDVRAGTSGVPLPEEWAGVLERVAFTSGIQRVSEEVSFGEGLQARSRRDLRFPAEFTLEWAGGLVTRYRGVFSRGDGLDPTGETRRNQSEHGVSLETRLRPRRGLDGEMIEAYRVAFLAQHSTVEECRIPSGRAECVPFVDQLARAVSLTLDTMLSGFEVGGQLSLMDRRSFAGIRSGLTQFQLGIWGRMEFSAGPIDRFDRRRDPFQR